MKKPNIVYIHAHDLGRFCEPLGHAVPAPNLMRLAKQGVLFRQCHASAPTCAPSRAALLTGQYPHRCGMLGLPSPKLGYRLNDYKTHLASYLREQGYVTALAGVQHVARAPSAPPEENLPYDYFLNHTPSQGQVFDPGATVSCAVEFLLEPHDTPVFLSVGLLDPHRDNSGDRRTFIESQPMRQPADIDDEAGYCQPWPHMPDNEVTRREMANFKMGVKLMDSDVGRLLAALDSPELRANTLVIFTTDHGPGVCEMKATLRDHGTGVFMILRGPDDASYGQACAFEGGKVIDSMTQHLDLYPTITELIGSPPSHDLDGHSLCPLITGDCQTIHKDIFTEQTYHYDSNPRPYRAVHTERYKYIRSFKADQVRGIDRGPTQAFWEEYGYADQKVPDEQLYDLIFDPNEANNLAGADTHADVLTDLRTRLQNWMNTTHDPLKDGSIPGPPAQQET